MIDCILAAISVGGGVGGIVLCVILFSTYIENERND